VGQGVWEHIQKGLHHRNGLLSCPLCGLCFIESPEDGNEFWEHIKSRHGHNKEVLPSQKPVRGRVPDCPESFMSVLLMAIHIIMAPKHQLLCAVPPEVLPGSFTLAEHFHPQNSQHPRHLRILSIQSSSTARNLLKVPKIVLKKQFI
jgi:hypothetical protein